MRVASEAAKRKKKEIPSEGVEGPIGDEEAVSVATEPLLGDALSERKEKGKGKEKVVIDLASSGGKHEASPRERHSRRMFEELVGNVGQRLSNEAIQDLDLQAALGSQAFNRYLIHGWKTFISKSDMEDLLEASIACSIRLYLPR
ncbi:hypothetical protein Adt_35334 [Abeliophyllum distichum]|uniref:Uncharacterized protein n=1 Tax=Abeliophyllum distichum TaxID=126358 RepID=A0ABD1QEL3_9LAMI